METSKTREIMLEKLETAVNNHDYTSLAYLCQEASGTIDDSSIEQFAKTVINEAKRAIKDKEIEYALNLFAILVTVADKLYSNIPNGYDFASQREFIVYSSTVTGSEFIWIGFTRLDIYYNYGYLLVELQRIKQAQEIFKKALKIAPGTVMIFFEYAETYKTLGDYEVFSKLTFQAIKYAVTNEEIAHCLRNIGYSEIEKENYQLASTLYYISTEFEPQNMTAYKELSYISFKAKKAFAKPNKMEREQALGYICERSGISRERFVIRTSKI